MRPSVRYELGPNHGSVFVELKLGGELRQLEQVRRDQRPLERRRIRLGPRLDPIRRLLPQGGQIQIRLGIKAGKLVGPFVRRTGRRALRQRRERREGDQRGRQPADAAAIFPPPLHQRYPASVRALLQLMVMPRGPASTHARAWARSPLTLAQYLLTSRSHSLVTAARAATRFWMASKAWP